MPKLNEFNAVALAQIAIERYELSLEENESRRGYQSFKQKTAQITFLKLLETVRPDLVTRAFVLNADNPKLISTLVSSFSSDWRGKELLDILEASPLDAQYERLVAGKNIADFMRGHYDEGPEDGVQKRIISLIEAQPHDKRVELLCAERVGVILMHCKLDEGKALLDEVLEQSTDEQKAKILSVPGVLYWMAYDATSDRRAEIEADILSLPIDFREKIVSATKDEFSSPSYYFKEAFEIQPALL